MKKIILIVGAAFVCSCVISCASVPSKPETAAQVSGTELLDWQGSEFGKGVPDWVEYVSSQNYEKLSILPESKNKTLIAIEGYGDDRDLVRIWVETDRASGEMTNRIEQAVTREAGTVANGNKDSSDAKIKMAKAVTGIFSQSKINGFQRLSTFWTQVKRKADGVMEYRYYALFGIDNSVLDEQLALVMGKIEAKTAEEKNSLDEINRVVQLSAHKAGVITSEVR
ncbi:hypothetical protein [uncultured Treponema sp.]|uniref:hypothetical protein n=1 Tax=uncultured Treponema sp. TaxID=162155 RepID=UPI0025F73352|nr:hypothetical protein [uncultured Treponema sp.]